jgi:hypothetical protein
MLNVRTTQILVFAVVTIAIGGCTIGLDSRVGADDPPIWGRTDCQRGEGNPELQGQYNDAKTTCLARGETEDMVAGNTGGSSCMTEQGYVLRTRAGHAAACQGVEQSRLATPVKKQASKQKPKKPAPPDRKSVV